MLSLIKQYITPILGVFAIIVIIAYLSLPTWLVFQFSALLTLLSTFIIKQGMLSNRIREDTDTTTRKK